jgi:SnoaL-like domain
MASPCKSPESALADLIAKQEITELLYRYCQGCDHSDEEVLRSCFHPDCITDHAGWSGKSHDWVPLALAWLKDRVAVTHAVTNIYIQVDGDRAILNCHFFAYNRSPKPGTDKLEEFMAKGRYIDRMERRDGVWKIAHRIGIHDLERVVEVPASVNEIGGDRSGKKPDDPYYGALRDFLAGR